MREVVDEEVSIVLYYSSKTRKTVPYRLHWQSKDYELGPVDYYHTYMEGQAKMHVFELCDKQESLWFRLRLDGDNLHWILEMVHDGLAD